MAIQEEFKDSYEMTSRAISLIKENQNELTEIRHGYFEDIPMGYMGANIKLSIHSVYENGVIYDITCYPDAGAGAYDIYTKAYLICVNGLEPEFKISSLGYVDEALLGSRIDKELIDYLKGNNPKEKT